jgi:hypothetical protein
LRLQILALRNTIGKKAVKGAICGICSTGGLVRIARPIRQRAEFAPGPTQHQMGNRNFLMKPACVFMVAARFGVDWFVLHGGALAQSLP